MSFRIEVNDKLIHSKILTRWETREVFEYYLLSKTKETVDTTFVERSLSLSGTLFSVTLINFVRKNLKAS